jgi:tRNA nucleotidyltransferase (CCA-adding enzyme)
VPQDPIWHPEGPVHVHLGLAADAAAAAADRQDLDQEERTVVVLAAMLHDLGKTAENTQIRDDPVTGGQRITSHLHDKLAEVPVRSFLKRIGAPERLTPKIVPLVREHMQVAQSATPSAATDRRLVRRLAGPAGKGPTIQQWAAVVGADHAGRGSASRPSPADAWLRVLEADELDRPRAPILTGDHLIAAGMRPGPQF